MFTPIERGPMPERGTETLIIAGVDFSDTAALALARARRLAGLIGARLEVFHVAEGSPAGVAERKVRARARPWLERHGVPEHEFAVGYGTAWVELARRASTEGAAMLVVGSHGAGGFHPLLPGSTASKLAALSSVPVLIVTPRTVPAAAGTRVAAAG